MNDVVLVTVGGQVLQRVSLVKGEGIMRLRGYIYTNDLEACAGIAGGCTAGTAEQIEKAWLTLRHRAPE